MTKKLKSNYAKYRTTRNKKVKNLGFFREFMNEIVYRTTKLEAEPITRRMVRSIIG